MGCVFQKIKHFWHGKFKCQKSNFELVHAGGKFVGCFHTKKINGVYRKVMLRYEYYFPVAITTIYERAHYMIRSQNMGQNKLTKNTKSRRKTHAFFMRYIFFHIFTSEKMENTSVLVYAKTPRTI